ncbi:SH3 domain-containing protein [Neobacillus sp. WH10]|uniref:SH3 domain-containing protein n=1 Tax=Neobacillus sp. WH10 TaxID=3047873 RepID=UPI0024C1E86A|nr:SH3 domain-containing protein [Neobacillus sp. WH10]WHY78424.1 SH3 domain-containing protein [Neobacillus sp. WH10]
MQRYTVIKGHISNYPDPIVLKKEQEVLYGKEDTQFPNWIFCKSITTNKEGWVPKQILTAPNNHGIAIVTKDYSAHELTANQGEILLCLEHLNDWTYCKTENGEIGWIPTSCLSEQ